MAAPKKIVRTHDDVLEEVAQALDIPPSKFEEAKDRYEALGAWLDRPESTLASYNPEITPQGSILLGTVTRPLSVTEEYDIDLVCLLKASKADFTQKTLKDAIGFEVRAYARACNMDRNPEERRRCWTLHYADDAQFHMDVLPALPDVQRYQLLLELHGHRDLVHNSTLTGQAIAITDNTLPQYAEVTDDWPQSNPIGYAAWFRTRMSVQLTEQKKAFAGRQLITTSVDDIPDYKVRTPLQRTIQLLKRHRDCMFADDPEDKPISIIITTLAAHAYGNEPTISAALQTVLTTMERYIEYHGDEAWVANPVNPSENFADKWAENPRKRENFFRWLERARADFAQYLRASSYDDVPDVLKENLGSDLVDRVFKAVASATITAPAVVRTPSDNDDLRRVEAAIDDVRRTGTQSKPWAKL